MVRASEFNSEDPGFDPLAEQGKGQFFVSLLLLVNSCADLFVPDPSFVCTTRTQMCAHVKDLISICRKRVGITAGGMETRKHYTQGKKLGSAVLHWLLTSKFDIREGGKKQFTSTYIQKKTQIFTVFLLYICLLVCRFCQRQYMSKMCTLFCLVQIKSVHILTSCAI